MITATHFLRASLLAALLGGASAPAFAAPVKNIVLVHGAWVDGSGSKPVYEILKRDGYTVSIAQEPLASLEADVTATKRIPDLQDGPTILVAHSYGGSIITEAGVHPNVVGLVYVAAHAPERERGAAMDAVVAQRAGDARCVTPQHHALVEERRAAGRFGQIGAVADRMPHPRHRLVR